MAAINTQSKASQSSMGWSLLFGLPPYEVVRAFCELLARELNHRNACGPAAQALRQYYRRLFLADGTPSPLGVYGYASRLAPVLAALREAKSPVRLLDAGCGYGTESLLLALSGADVTGVELVPERVKLARSRTSFYQEHTSTALSIRFVNANVIRYLEKAGPFDIIWIMEAVSHIHPLEILLPLAYERLSPDGLLITSDPNALNPIALYRAYRIRGAPHYTLRLKGQDPSNGAPVYEAVERIFSVPGYARRLKKAGFRVQEITVSGFMAASLVPAPLHKSKVIFTLLTSLQRTLQAFPILRQMGVNYTVVAQKAVCGDASWGQRQAQA